MNDKHLVVTVLLFVIGSLVAAPFALAILAKNLDWGHYELTVDDQTWEVDGEPEFYEGYVRFTLPNGKKIIAVGDTIEFNKK